VKVGIDVRHITDFGVGTYIRNVLRTLTRLDRENQYCVIGDTERIHEIGELPPNFHPVPFAAEEYSLRGNLRFRALVKEQGCDLVHVPHLLPLPIYLTCPYVVTVHDLLDYMYRADRHGGLRRSFHFTFTRMVLERAARIFAV
jgi:glycosyltransferase involved in cell wall biosynthesis